MREGRRLSKMTMVERDSLILRLKAQGLTAEQIAPQVRLGLSQIRRILDRKGGSNGLGKS